MDNNKEIKFTIQFTAIITLIILLALMAIAGLIMLTGN